MDDVRDLIKKNLKILLFDLASKSEEPAEELEKLLSEVISEMYWEAKETLETRKQKLRIVT